MEHKPAIVLAVVLFFTLMIAGVSGGEPLLLAEEPGQFNYIQLPAIFNLHPIPTPTPTPTPPPSDLRISRIVYSARDEYVEISNHGAGSQDMSGWRILSVVGNQTYGFPEEYILGAGSYLRVHSGPEAGSESPRNLIWTTGYVWNNGGDEAILYDDVGKVVDRSSY